jgi:hypothetical protein
MYFQCGVANQHSSGGDDCEVASRSTACTWHQTTTGSKNVGHHRRLENGCKSLCCYMKQSTTIAGLNNHTFSTPRQKPPRVPYRSSGCLQGPDAYLVTLSTASNYTSCGLCLGVPLMCRRTARGTCKRKTLPLTAYFQPSPQIR